MVKEIYKKINKSLIEHIELLRKFDLLLPDNWVWDEEIKKKIEELEKIDSRLLKDILDLHRTLASDSPEKAVYLNASLLSLVKEIEPLLKELENEIKNMKEIKNLDLKEQIEHKNNLELFLNKIKSTIEYRLNKKNQENVSFEEIKKIQEQIEIQIEENKKKIEKTEEELAKTYEDKRELEKKVMEVMEKIESLIAQRTIKVEGEVRKEENKEIKDLLNEKYRLEKELEDIAKKEKEKMKEYVGCWLFPLYVGESCVVAFVLYMGFGKYLVFVSELFEALIKQGLETKNIFDRFVDVVIYKISGDEMNRILEQQKDKENSSEKEKIISTFLKDVERYNSPGHLGKEIDTSVSDIAREVGKESEKITRGPLKIFKIPAKLIHEFIHKDVGKEEYKKNFDETVPGIDAGFKELNKQYEELKNIFNKDKENLPKEFYDGAKKFHNLLNRVNSAYDGGKETISVSDKNDYGLPKPDFSVVDYFNIVFILVISYIIVIKVFPEWLRKKLPIYVLVKLMNFKRRKKIKEGIKEIEKLFKLKKLEQSKK